MPRWYIVTPEYGEVVPITDEGYGPIEYGCDVIEIEADTKRDAVAFGVREMLKGGNSGHGGCTRYRWCLDQRSDGFSPYTGVRAELVPDEECLEEANYAM